MNERDRLCLQHILDAAARVRQFTAGCDEAAFRANLMVQDAVIRNLEVIGEACSKLDDAFKRAHPDVPWQKAAATRNRLLHGYFDVNPAVVWATVTTSLPRFEVQVKAILDAGGGTA